MKGTPLGGSYRRRVARAGVGSAVAVLALATASQSASASTLTVSRTGAEGKGTFAAAITKANDKPDPDQIVFSKRLRGSIRVRGRVSLNGSLVVEGNGYGKRGGKDFGRVVLEGPKRGALLNPEGRGSVSLRGLYLDRVAVDGSGVGLTVSDSYLTGRGTVESVGIGHAYGGDLRVLGSTVTGFELGVGLYRSSGRIDQSTIAGNTRFGGVVANVKSSIDVTNSTISGNAFQKPKGNFAAVGGGLSTGNGSSMSVVNSTITGNVAEGDFSMGGGIFGNVDVVNSTIADNTADRGGGIAGSDHGGIPRLADSIVADNTSAEYGSYEDCLGGVTSLGGNLIEDFGGCTQAEGDVNAVDPLLGPLASNGGPTRTMAIGSASPAVGLALPRTATKFDQRGVKRDGDPDAGAYER